MSKGLIWQDDENIIDVVYQTIYDLPVKEAIQVVKKYQEKQLIPIEWINENAGKYFSGLEVLHLYKMIEEGEAILNMLENWEKENETN